MRRRVHAIARTRRFDLTFPVLADRVNRPYLLLPSQNLIIEPRPSLFSHYQGIGVDRPAAPSIGGPRLQQPVLFKGPNRLNRRRLGNASAEIGLAPRTGAYAVADLSEADSVLSLAESECPPADIERDPGFGITEERHDEIKQFIRVRRKAGAESVRPQ